MSLEIYVDPKDPLAYLALPGTLELLQQTGCTAQWLPMLAAQWTHPGQQPPADAERGVRHRFFRAAYRERELQHYAGIHQLPITNLYRQTDSSHASFALLWLAKHSQASDLIPRFLQQLTQAHWADPQSTMAMESSILPALKGLTDTTSTFSAYCSEQGPLELEQQLEKNTALGVTRGPAYRLEDQLYIGREHLPLLHEMLVS